MRKAILGIFLLAYLSGFLTIVLGYVFVPSSGSEEQTVDFLEEVSNYSWVKDAHRYQSERELLYYRELTYLHSVDKRIGLNLFHARWLRDNISEEEARALSLLVALSKEDTEIALSVSQSLWFQRGISSDEVALLEKILTLSQQNTPVARNTASSTWFVITGTERVDQVISTVMDMPPDLALAVSVAPWFISDSSLSEFKAVQELITLYSSNENLAINLCFVYEPQDFGYLQQVCELYSTDRELADLFFQYNVLSRESFLSLSDLSQIAAVDREVAHSLVSTLTEEKASIISSLAAIYTSDPALGKVAGATFGNDKIALRYLQEVLKVGTFEHNILIEVAAFVSDNPEFVYEDRIEPYRYHLLTEILSELPLDKAQEYKDLIFVICEIYGSRFYRWQNAEYGTRSGWAYDEQLSDLEKGAVMELITFFIEKNEQGALVTDLRLERKEDLCGLADIPFTHQVIDDGTVVEAFHEEQGTGYVSSIIYNISTLRLRFEKVQEERQKMDLMQYGYSNPLVELILEEGEEKDRIFLYFCARNWELGTCVVHTLHTRMDSAAIGIPTTALYWGAAESAHMYPAYIPSASIAARIQADPGTYGNPFVYEKFCAPYDDAGFRDYLDKDIEVITIYDPQTEKKVALFEREGRGILDEKLLAIVVVSAGITVFFVVRHLRGTK